MAKRRFTSLLEDEREERSWHVILLICVVVYFVAFFLLGCVKTVYLPETAAYYRQRLEECMKQKATCERDVLDCIEKCDELELYVPSSASESAFASEALP